MRETLTRVLRSYGLARGEAAGLLSIQPTALRTDCDFDPDAWDRGEQDALDGCGIGRVVLGRLPAASATLLPFPQSSPPDWRAVIDIPAHTDKSSLAALHAAGVRGVRFNTAISPGDGLDPLLRFADRIVPFGWHVEINVSAAGVARALAKAEWRLMQFPLAVCFSGLGGQHEQRGSADFAFILGLMQLGRYWLKLSGKDLAPPQMKLWDEPPPLARTLLSVRKDRLIWGSGPAPAGRGAAHIAASLSMLEKCLPHPGDQEQVLVDNPARLYGFGDDHP